MNDAPSAKLPADVDTPSTYWTAVTGLESLQTWLALPEAGTLWVYYETGDAPAKSVYVWHEGGDTEPVEEGSNTFTVEGGDALVWTLASDTNTIKLAWGYE